MDYENKHREEIARATQLWECGDITRENLEYIFPEVRESKDEKIRKIIRGWIYTRPASFFDSGISKEETLAWLEKQSEKTVWTDNDRIMAFTLMRDVDQITYISEEGKNKRLEWLNSLEDRFNKEK